MEVRRHVQIFQFDRTEIVISSDNNFRATIVLAVPCRRLIGCKWQRLITMRPPGILIDSKQTAGPARRCAIVEVSNLPHPWERGGKSAKRFGGSTGTEQSRFATCRRSFCKLQADADRARVADRISSSNHALTERCPCPRYLLESRPVAVGSR